MYKLGSMAYLDGVGEKEGEKEGGEGGGRGEPVYGSEGRVAIQ